MVIQAELAQHLKNKKGVPEKDIIVMSQYKAQVSFLRKELAELGLPDITVNTVIASQGDLVNLIL